VDKARIGLIGCGGIATGFHAKNILDFPDVQVVAVADPVEERRNAMAECFGVKHIYKNHSDLYDHEGNGSLDAVYICIEPTAHTDSELRAIDLGLPFYIEKPMTLDITLADTIVKRAAEKNLITSCGFQDRYLDVFNLMRDELKAHKPGGLVYGAWVGGTPQVWWWLKKEYCGGQLVEQNIHILDGLRYLFGEAKSIYATASRGIVDDIEGYDTDDHSTAVIEFENNVTATLVSGCYIRGTNAFSGIIVNLQDMVIEYRLRHSVTFKTQYETKEILRATDQGITADRVFIDAVKSGDASRILSPYSDGIKTLKLGFAANRSMETGKVVRF